MMMPSAAQMKKYLEDHKEEADKLRAQLAPLCSTPDIVPCPTCEGIVAYMLMTEAEKELV